MSEKSSKAIKDAVKVMLEIILVVLVFGIPLVIGCAIVAQLWRWLV
jgi:hypothetical protein